MVDSSGASGTGPAVDLEFDRALLKQCVHCGLCLDACPTYRVLGTEMDGPRGRIYQIKSVFEGKIAPDDPYYAEHIYACLDCRACQTVCPAGVQYGTLVEGARGATRPPGGLERRLGGFFLHQVFSRGWALDLAAFGLRFYQRSGLQALLRATDLPGGRLGRLERLLAPAQGGLFRAGLAAVTEPVGAQRHRVGLISGCVMSRLMSETNAATVRVLARNGCQVQVPPEQVCCGALHVHSGEREAARALARRNIEVFEALELDAVIVNAAGCGSTLKEYGDLLAGDSDWRARAERFAGRVRDVSEFLASIELNRNFGPVRKRVTYQDPCHLVHGQGIRRQPRELLEAIPGLELIELAESDTCCGSAGIYNLTHYDLSMQILEPKLDHLAATGAEVVVAPNPGCAMQLAAGCQRRQLDLTVAHVVDLLDESYQAAEQQAVVAAVVASH